MQTRRSLDRARQCFAAEVLSAAGVVNPALRRALCGVPREDFLGPGPWRLQGAGWQVTMTPDADARHVQHNVAVVSSSGRLQHAPVLLMVLLDRLDLSKGQRALVIGHDVGYAASLVRHVTGNLQCAGLELMPDACLEPSSGSSAANGHGPFDAVLLLAGCSAPPWPWLQRLKPGGRAIFPLLGCDGIALYWHVQAPLQSDRWSAQALASAECLPCEEFWDADEAALADAMAHRLLDVCSLSPRHDDGEDMVLVQSSGCFSLRPAHAA